MKEVTCVVDIHPKLDAQMLQRTKVFNQLCLLFMLLRCWDRTILKCDCGCNCIKSWVIDWDHHPASSAPRYKV